jgi:transcriptional regulator with XRE-family HTH domain
MPSKPRDIATPRDQMTAMGAAIRELRKMAGSVGDRISTSEAGRRAGVSRQTWENYENARGPVILRQDVQDQIAHALGVTRADLLNQYRRMLGDEIAELQGFDDAPPQSAWPMPASGQVRQVIMPDDTLRPWASSGMTIAYDRNLWPSPDVGVVLEPNEGGDKVVKIFGHADAEAYHCYELYPERRTVTFPRSAYRAFRVVARLG